MLIKFRSIDNLILYCYKIFVECGTKFLDFQLKIIIIHLLLYNFIPKLSFAMTGLKRWANGESDCREFPTSGQSQSRRNQEPGSGDPSIMQGEC